MYKNICIYSLLLSFITIHTFEFKLSDLEKNIKQSDNAHMLAKVGLPLLVGYYLLNSKYFALTGTGTELSILAVDSYFNGVPYKKGLSIITQEGTKYIMTQYLTSRQNTAENERRINTASLIAGGCTKVIYDIVKKEDLSYDLAEYVGKIAITQKPDLIPINNISPQNKRDLTGSFLKLALATYRNDKKHKKEFATELGYTIIRANYTAQNYKEREINTQNN